MIAELNWMTAGLDRRRNYRKQIKIKRYIELHTDVWRYYTNWGLTLCLCSLWAQSVITLHVWQQIQLLALIESRLE